MRYGAALLCLASVGTPLRAQLAPKFGPHGEITVLRAGSAEYLRDLAVTIVKPGWVGAMASQSDPDTQILSVHHSATVTTYVLRLHAEATSFILRASATKTANDLRLSYELTPARDVATETVMLRAVMPTPLHAGKTRYVVVGPGIVRGVCPAALPEPYILHSGPVDWIGFAAPGAQALRLQFQAMTCQFQDDRKWDTPSFSIMGHATHGKLAAGRPIRFALTLSAMPPQTMDAMARDAERNDLMGLPLQDSRPLHIRAVTSDRSVVPTYDTVELRADLTATYANPFDPDEIAVEAIVTTPDRRTLRIPGFFGAPMKVDVRGETERLRMAGKAGFFVRYTPTKPGVHRIVLTVRDRSGTARWKPIAIRATSSNASGFVRVSKHDPHYFACDDGKPFVPIGENLCWANGPTPLRLYSQWLGGLGKAGANCVRLWLAFNEKGLEWMPAPTPKGGTGTYLGLGRYALDNAWRLDEVVRMARANGVRLMFCVGTYGEFTDGGFFNEGSWISNPYNARNGGPCARPEDFWTNEKARRLYKQRLRYLIARYGHSPFLFAWEFWNEVPPTPTQARWVAEMAAYLKQHDPYRHLVSTTYGDRTVWTCPDVDFSMTHMYGQAGNTPDFTPQIVAHAREHRQYRKPYLLAEFGIDWQTSDSRWDPSGIGTNMHNGAWAALMAGAAGTAMLWYWDGYVHPNNLYHVFTPIHRYVGSVDWTGAGLQPAEAIELRTAPDAMETFKDVTIPGTVEWGLTPSNEYTVLHDGTVLGRPAVAMAIGSPERSIPRELHTEITWHLDLQRPTPVRLKLGQVCTRAHMVIQVDGKTIIERELTAGEPGKGPWKSSRRLEQYGVWVSDYDEDLVLDLAAGRHAIRVQNTGGDWFQIRSITIPGYQSSRYPDVNALGLVGKHLLLLWLHNRESTWKTDYDGKRPSTLRGLTAVLPVSKNGTWQVEWWDTWKGKVFQHGTAVSRSGMLELPVPPLERDMAAVVRLVR